MKNQEKNIANAQITWLSKNHQEFKTLKNDDRTWNIQSWTPQQKL